MVSPARSLPRATLTRMASASAAPIRPCVARVSGALINNTSAASRSSLSCSGPPIHSTPSSVRSCRLMAAACRCQGRPDQANLEIHIRLGSEWLLRGVELRLRRVNAPQPPQYPGATYGDSHRATRRSSANTNKSLNLKQETPAPQEQMWSWIGGYPANAFKIIGALGRAEITLPCCAGVNPSERSSRVFA